MSLGLGFLQLEPLDWHQVTHLAQSSPYVFSVEGRQLVSTIASALVSNL